MYLNDLLKKYPHESAEKVLVRLRARLPDHELAFTGSRGKLEDRYLVVDGKRTDVHWSSYLHAALVSFHGVDTVNEMVDLLASRVRAHLDKLDRTRTIDS